MQIREKARKILLIRTEYIKEKKRTIGKTIASLNRYSSTAPADVLEQLSEPEQVQLSQWLAEREREQQERHKRYSAEGAAATLTTAAEAVRAGLVEVGDEQAGKMYQAIDVLTKALRAKGFTRQSLK